MRILDIIFKFFAFVRLSGENFEDKLYVHRAKVIYLLNRLHSFIFPSKHKPLGKFLVRDVWARISYGKFYCRKYEEDLSIISESFEFKTIRKFIKLARGKNLVVDVGAHIGKYTILAAKLAKNVIAIEPHKENFKILKRNVRLNKLKNVYTLNLAASSRNSKLKLYIGDTSGHHSISKKSKDYQVVDGIKLDTFFKRLKLEKIDLIKIDVEGAEMQVLLGMKEYLRNRKIKNIIIEIWPNNLKKVKRFFSGLGYFIKPIEDDNFLVEC